MTASITEIIAKRTVDIAVSDLPAKAMDVMRLSLLDWIAVGIAGSDEPVSKIIRESVVIDGGAAVSNLFGTTKRVPMRAAAVANGTISHALDYDDTHFGHVGHTSVVVISAAMAVAEARDISGHDFLAACLIGSEAACTIGAWLGATHYNAGFHQTATAGAFGATVAVGRLLGLDADQMRHAMGLAATRAAGLKSQFGTMGKPYNAGTAAAVGVEVARLAEFGMQGQAAGLECLQGFGDTHQGEANAGYSAFLQTFEFPNVQHKLHACCHGLHAAIEALGMLRDQWDVQASNVDGIEIRTNPRWLKVCDVKKPVAGLEAKFSYTLTAAMVFEGWDTAALGTYCDAAYKDAALIALRDRVTVIGDDDVGDMQARVRLRTKDREVLQADWDLADVLPLDQRIASVQQKATTLIGAKRAEAIWTAISDLESMSTLDFVEVLRGQWSA